MLRSNLSLLGSLAVGLALLCCAMPSQAGADGPKKALVLLEDLAMKGTHSAFLKDLADRGYSLDVKAISDSSNRLRDWDEWAYDKLAILGSKKSLGGAVSVDLVAEFVDAGRDVLLATDSSASEELRALAQELGVDVDASGTAVIDHFSYDAAADSGDHTAVLASKAVASKAVWGAAGAPGPVLFRGIAMSVSPDSESAFLALSGSPTAYSGKPGQAVTEVNLAGADMGLVALVQAQNNARAAVIGSLDALSDAFYAAPAAKNAAFMGAVSRWAFSERGVLRAQRLVHRVVGGPDYPEIYRINDDVQVEVAITECEDGACKPFRADDVQVEFVMLDPHVRVTLAGDAAGLFSATVKVPDVYGVFKWVLDYRRLGYSYLDLVETVPVRPFRHNEYERFIVQAYPYYASIATTMAGFFALGFAFLYSK